MKNGILITLIALIVMSACSNFKEKADLIVLNGKVYTVNEKFDTVQAFAIKEGKFIATGSNKNILNHFQSPEVFDAQGKPVYPGFNDAHCHFFSYGYGLLKRIDLVGTKSYKEVIEKLKVHHKKYNTEWIEGRGWDQNDWEVQKFPTKGPLDEAFPNNPVYLVRIDGHAAIVNSKALEIAGITATTKVNGGEIFVENGKPTGLLLDNAMELVNQIIPKPDKAFIKKALLIAQDSCFAVGLTSVTDAGLDRDTVKLIDELQQEGSLKMRINAMLTPNSENVEYYIKKGPYQTDKLTVRSIKLYADGALGSRGARLIEPYSDDPGNMGLFLFKEDFYKKYCQIALQYNFQVNTHAIGDGANRFILQLYSGFLKGKNDLRWRIEHAQVVAPEDFKLFGEYSIIPSVQPTHATSDMYWAEDRLGPERIKGAYANKELLDENGWEPLGTDFPIENINPLYTFYAAVARKDLKGWPEGGFQSENALSREEALRGMTIWAAKGSFDEKRKGSIEPGKFADFVVLDKDIMTIPIDSVPDIKVYRTYSAGLPVFKEK